MCQHFFSKKETIQMANRSVKTEMVLEKLADFYLSKNSIAKLHTVKRFIWRSVASIGSFWIHFTLGRKIREKFIKYLDEQCHLIRIQLIDLMHESACSWFYLTSEWNSRDASKHILCHHSHKLLRFKMLEILIWDMNPATSQNANHLKHAVNSHSQNLDIDLMI